MRIYYKTGVVALTFLCLIFLSQTILAQDISGLKSDIYSKLECCPCPTSFDKCVCPEAKEMKAYIDALLEAGMDKEEIFYRVAGKFSLNVIIDEEIKADVEKRLIDEAGENHPRIILESVSYDFGRVSKKQGEIAKTFSLFNDGNSVLIIKNLKTTCPCAVVSLKVGQEKTPYFGTGGAPEEWQAKIEPGKSGELELKVDLADSHVRLGKLLREARISSNDPVYPEMKVTIEAMVAE